MSCSRPLGESERGLACGICWSRLPYLPSPLCDRCGHPSLETGCKWCELLPPYVRAVRSVCWMPVPPASNIVHALKYDQWPALALEIAERMSRLDWPRDVVAERKALVPVPLSRGRERERGYNQSALLASALATRWGIEAWNDCLCRARDTRSQTELTAEQRRTNVADSVRFHSLETARLRGAHVVLVDDVVTTAATLNECARVLFEAGARIISYVTFGRARSAGDRT